jgi:hypothetical protein
VGATVAAVGRDVAREGLAVVAESLDGREAKDVDGARDLVTRVREAEPRLGADQLRELL